MSMVPKFITCRHYYQRQLFLLFIFALIPHLVGASHPFIHLEPQLSPNSSV